MNDVQTYAKFSQSPARRRVSHSTGAVITSIKRNVTNAGRCNAGD